MINGTTEIIAHLGYPTHSFKAPMIYNPCVAQAASMRCAVTPMAACRATSSTARDSCAASMPRLPRAAWPG